jgi:hypothetical protein
MAKDFTKDELKHIKKTIKGFKFLEKKQRVKDTEEMDKMDKKIISKIKKLEVEI